MRLYLAGPMTGYKDFNFPLFHAVIAKLRAAGHEVVNPAEVNPDTSLSWADCMRRDIPELLTCQGVAVLPGWEASNGARLEVHIAAKLGLPIYHINTFQQISGRTALIHELLSHAPLNATPSSSPSVLSVSSAPSVLKTEAA